MAVNGHSTHVRRMKWDVFVGALGRRPLVLTVAKSRDAEFDSAQLLDIVGTGGGGMMMNMATGEMTITLQPVPDSGRTLLWIECTAVHSFGTDSHSG